MKVEHNSFVVVFVDASRYWVEKKILVGFGEKKSNADRRKVTRPFVCLSPWQLPRKARRVQEQIKLMSRECN